MDTDTTIQVRIADIAAALKINDGILDVAREVVIDKVPYTSTKKGRSFRDKWQKFDAFSKAVGLPYHAALDAIDGKLDETYFSPQQINQHRLDALQKTNDKLLKDIQKAQAHTHNIVDSLLNEVGKLPKVTKMPDMNVPDAAPTTAMVDLSDWHIGSAWNNADTGFGDASTDILTERVDLLTRKVVTLSRLQKRISPIPRLCINFLGDIAENAGMHYSSGVHVDRCTIRQVSSAINASENMLTEFLSEFDDVIVNCVFGNHGRIGAKGEQHILDNWDVLIYTFLAGRFIDEPRIKFNISTTPYMAYILDDQPDWVHCITHGDGMPAPFSLPLYSITRAEANISKLLDRSINYSHFAHWHNMAQMDKTFGAIFINGSLVGTSPHGISLRLAGQAKQLFLGFNAEYGQTFEYPIYLQSHKRAEPDEHGILTPYVTDISQLN